MITDEEFNYDSDIRKSTIRNNEQTKRLVCESHFECAAEKICDKV
jgi:hypothetical protein